jgi:hypothetical protein
MPKKQWLILKKDHGKANARALTGAEIAARQFNARERKQRLREREQHAIDLTLGPRPQLIDIPQFGCEDIAIIIGQETLLVRMTPLLPPSAQEAAEEPQEELQKGGEEEELPEEPDPFILPASTAPALLESSSRPKRARGPTLDYKVMHEGRQIAPKRGK